MRLACFSLAVTLLLFNGLPLEPQTVRLPSSSTFDSATTPPPRYGSPPVGTYDPSNVPPSTSTFDPYATQPPIVGVQPPAVELGTPLVPLETEPILAIPPLTYVPQVPTNWWEIYGDFMYLRPSSSAAVDFAVPINGAIVPPPTPPVPVGPVVAVDPRYNAGFRFGFSYHTSHVTQWGASYSFWEGSTQNSVSVDPLTSTVLRSLTIHPGTTAADLNFLDASANISYDLDLIDIDYRYALLHSSWLVAKLYAGGRFAHLNQDFSSTFTNTTTVEQVSSQVHFDGGGIRLGLEGEMHLRHGFFLYSNGYTSFVAGRMHASYSQQDNFAGTVVNTAWAENRIVPILDIELGIGWLSPARHWRLSAGYVFSGWNNFTSNKDIIRAVHTGNYDSLHDAFILDGLTARAEFRF